MTSIRPQARAAIGHRHSTDKYELAAAYPSSAASRRLVWKALWLASTNPVYYLQLAALHLALLLTLNGLPGGIDARYVLLGLFLLLAIAPPSQSKSIPELLRRLTT